jgi:hypothetical protein
MTYIYNIEWTQCWADKKAYTEEAVEGRKAAVLKSGLSD